jgi:5-methylcytosine-specific restriction enzyme subunit McrC
MAAFVVDMAAVYEDFIGTALRESLTRFPGGTHVQYKSHLDLPDHDTRLTMYVDVVHVVSGAPRIIFDAKYKAADPRGSYPNADHYQMLAYCTALAVPTAWLVYAGGGPPRRRRIANTAITVVEYPLDLSAHPRELLAQVDRLAQAAWQEQSRQLNRSTQTKQPQSGSPRPSPRSIPDAPPRATAGGRLWPTRPPMP